jgi:ParB-like chromosome segregation protein Spo0J
LEGTGTYLVLDGAHRYAAATRLGLRDLACRVEEGAGYPEAVEANLWHGLPLSRQSRKDDARYLHEQDSSRSLREIRRRCGLSDKTVRAALADDPTDATENPQAPRPQPDALQKLLRLLLAAAQERPGADRLAAFFSGKTPARQQADYLHRLLAEYEEDERSQLASALTALGQACIAGARPYLTTGPRK